MKVAKLNLWSVHTGSTCPCIQGLHVHAYSLSMHTGSIHNQVYPCRVCPYRVTACIWICWCAVYIHWRLFTSVHVSLGYVPWSLTVTPIHIHLYNWAVLMVSSTVELLAQVQVGPSCPAIHSSDGLYYTQGCSHTVPVHFGIVRVHISYLSMHTVRYVQVVDPGPLSNITVRS